MYSLGITLVNSDEMTLVCRWLPNNNVPKVGPCIHVVCYDYWDVPSRQIQQLKAILVTDDCHVSVNSH